MPACLDAALAYAERGWKVFPADGKVPFKGTHGSLDATCNLVTIARWWKDRPYANCVIVTGEASGLTVLDVDMHKDDGKATLRALCAQHGALPATPVSNTGGDGRHILFALSGAIKCGPIEGQPGLEFVKWFVAPPSAHPSGKRYEWHAKYGLETPLALVPEWLVGLAKAELRPAFSGDGHYVLKEGERHYGLLKFAGWLRDRGLCEAAMAETLMAVNTYHCNPPMSERDIYELAHDVEQRYPAGKGLPIDVKRKERDERLVGL